MNFDLRDMSGPRLDEAARHYEEHGFFILDGVADGITTHFRSLLAEKMGVAEAEMPSILDPDSPPTILPTETRERLSKITTSPDLADRILSALKPIFLRLLGPLVHVSSTFHGQFKSGKVKAVDHGGYGSDYSEVQGQYLLHQDFAGAAIPTSPSALTLWVGLNSCSDWNLRLYPGSHRHGLLCNEWMRLDDPRLGSLADPIDIQSRAGSAVIFNALLLHGSSNPGTRRRVSCDIRFFPLCGFLPSDTHFLDENPKDAIDRGLERDDGPTLRSPLLEDLAFLGEEVNSDAPPCSILNWPNYVSELINGSAEDALDHMSRFVNAEVGIDELDAYASKFHDRPIHEEKLEAVRSQLVASSRGINP